MGVNSCPHGSFWVIFQNVIFILYVCIRKKCSNDCNSWPISINFCANSPIYDRLSKPIDQKNPHINLSFGKSFPLRHGFGPQGVLLKDAPFFLYRQKKILQSTEPICVVLYLFVSELTRKTLMCFWLNTVLMLFINNYLIRFFLKNNFMNKKLTTSLRSMHNIHIYKIKLLFVVEVAKNIIFI